MQYIDILLFNLGIYYFISLFPFIIRLYPRETIFLYTSIMFVFLWKASSPSNKKEMKPPSIALPFLIAKQA